MTYYKYWKERPEDLARSVAELVEYMMGNLLISFGAVFNAFLAGGALGISRKEKAVIGLIFLAFYLFGTVQGYFLIPR
jgi:hypothetical protein